MRISKFMLPAVTVAGALALAGCGGGSDSTETVPPVVPPVVPPADTGGYKDITPTGADVDVNTGGLSAGRIAAGGAQTIPRSNVTITCTGTEDCAYRVTASGNIEVSGQATASIPVAPEPAAPQAAGHWLTASNLVGAIPNDADAGARNSIPVVAGGIKRTVTANGQGDTATPTFIANAQHGDAKVSSLILRHDRGAPADNGAADGNFLVWGVWLEPVQGTGSDIPRSVSGGSLAYKGTFPTSGANVATNGTARYVGDNGFHGFVNGTAWTSDVRLTADFNDKTISGIVGNLGDGTAAAATDSTVGTASFNSITLKQTGIGATMSGSAVIVGADDTISHTTDQIAPSSGTWKAGFFGPASDAPSDIAGELSVTRPAAGATSSTALNPHERVTKLSIVGAFGAGVNNP